MNLRFYPRYFTLDPRQKPTLFFTLSLAYELSLAFQHHIFMIPLRPFSAVLGMDLAGNMDPCYLTRYPKLMTYPGRKPFFFWQCVLDFVVVWYFVLPGEIYFPASWCSYYMMLPLLSIKLQAKNLFENQLQDLLLQVPFPLYPDTFSFSWV